MYSDFYEIPLPALHFEKTEEIHIKVRNDTEERNDAFQIGHVKRNEKTSAINDAHPRQKKRRFTSKKNDT